MSDEDMMRAMHGEDTKGGKSDSESNDLVISSNDLNNIYDCKSDDESRDGYTVHGGDHFSQLMEAGQASTLENEEEGQSRRRFFSKRSIGRSSSESWNMQSSAGERDMRNEKSDITGKESPQNKTIDNCLREIEHNNRSISIDRSQSIEVRRLLRMASMSVVSNHVDERSLDEKRLSRAVSDAGEFANGIIGVEVWTLNEETGRLERPPGGWWRHESFASKLAKWSVEERKALCTFEESTHPDFIPVGPTSPGVDLAGELWVEGSASASTKLFGGRISHEVRRAFSPWRQRDNSEDDGSNSTPSSPSRSTSKCQQNISNENRKTHQRFPSGDFLTKPRTLNNREPSALFSRSYDSRLRLGLFPSAESLTVARQESPIRAENSSKSGQPCRGAILWRDVHSLVVDPDISKTPRLVALEKVGLGLAAGVHFDVGGHSGIVIYFASSRENTDILTALPNQVYMIRMAELVVAVVASTDARRAAVASKLGQREGMPNNHASDESSTFSPSRETIFRQRIKMWFQKCRGGELQIPPSMTFAQSFWTAFGAFSSLILLSGSNEFIIKSSNEKYFLLMGPIGALVTLQYGLTAAPASQPRTIILGQCVAGVTSLVFTYVPTQVLQPWLRVALAPAISIGIMAKLGIIHPPAGAASVVLSSGQFNWVFFFIFIVCNVLSLVPAIAINNMSRKRQYPTYWGNLWCCSLSLFRKIKKSTTQ